MASKERRDRERENLRRAILNAARDLFVSEDYKAVSMRRIADQIEYSPATIYLHFKDKEEILACLCKEGFEMLGERLRTIEADDPVERLRQGGYAYIDFALTQPQYYKIMFQIEDRAIAAANVEQQEMARAASDFIYDCVMEALQKNRFRSDMNPSIISHVIWAHIHGAAALTLSGRLMTLPTGAHRMFYSALIDTTLRGLSAD